DRGEQFRVGGQVEQVVRRQVLEVVDVAQVAGEGLHPLGGADVGGVVPNAAQERLPLLRRRLRLGQEGREGLADVLAEGVVAFGVPPGADEAELLREEAALPEGEERRQQLAGRQVAGGAEEDEGERLGRLPAGQERRAAAGGLFGAD